MLTTLTDVVVDPMQAFEGTPRKHPWVWALCLAVALGATVPMSVFMYSQRGREAFEIGQQREFERIRSRYTAKQYEQILVSGQRHRDTVWWNYGIRNTIASVMFIVVLSAVVWYLSAPFAAARPTFSEVLAIVALASVLFVFEAIFISAFNAVFETVALRADLETLFPVELPAIVGHVNPFTIWWILIVSAGLGRAHGIRPWMFSAPLLGMYVLGAIVSGTGVSLGNGLPNFH